MHIPIASFPQSGSLLTSILSGVNADPAADSAGESGFAALLDGLNTASAPDTLAQPLDNLDNMVIVPVALVPLPQPVLALASGLLSEYQGTGSAPAEPANIAASPAATGKALPDLAALLANSASRSPAAGNSAPVAADPAGPAVAGSVLLAAPARETMAAMPKAASQPLAQAVQTGLTAEATVLPEAEPTLPADTASAPDGRRNPASPAPITLKLADISLPAAPVAVPPLASRSTEQAMQHAAAAATPAAFAQKNTDETPSDIDTPRTATSETPVASRSEQRDTAKSAPPSAPIAPSLSAATGADTPSSQPVLLQPHALPGTSQPAPPTTVAAPMAPAYDLSQILDRLTAARDALAPATATLAVRHAEFGSLSLTFDQSRHGELTAELTAPDAETQRAVAQALVAVERSGQTAQDTSSRQQNAEQSPHSASRNALAERDGGGFARQQDQSSAQPAPAKRSAVSTAAASPSDTLQAGIFA